MYYMDLLSPFSIADMHVCSRLTTWDWITMQEHIPEENKASFLSSHWATIVALHLGVGP